MDSITWMSYYLNECQTLSNTSQMTIFLSGRQRTGALCVQHSPTAAQRSRLMQHLSENVIFVFPVLPGSAKAQVT